VSAAATVIEFLDLRLLHADLAERLGTAWRSVLVSGRFMSAPEVEAFEAEFARYCEAAGCLFVANGADALELVLSALGIGQNDEVIVPANASVATAEAVCAVGEAFANLAAVAGPLPVTENAAERVLPLPMWPTPDPRDVDRVCDVLLEIG
jgi:dTDP-4-amino-4,6-dideoxygalactose transaminase